MSDKISTYNTLKFVATFTDGDTRTISMDSPNTSLNLGQAIKNLEDVASRVLIGDKFGAPFDRFVDARTVAGTRVDLDLSADQS